MCMIKQKLRIKELAAQIYSPQYLKHLNLNDDEDFI